MTNFTGNTLRQLDALNTWLGDVYDGETQFSTLLIDAGFSKAEVQQLKHEHLSEFLQAVQGLLESYNLTPIDTRNHMVMVQHYGLNDGTPQSFHVIGNSVGVCGERIRQLVTRRVNFYCDPIQQAKLVYDFAAIGRHLLDNEGKNQQ